MSATAGTIAGDARRESRLWGDALRPDPEWEAIFSPLAPEGVELGLETIYEGYLVHYGRPRLFSTGEASERVLLGDYLYAHGLVRICATGGVDAVSVMAGLISRCASLRAAGEEGDGEAWIEATRLLGGAPAGDEIATALRRHAARMEP